MGLVNDQDLAGRVIVRQSGIIAVERAAEVEVAAEDIPLEVLYEDADLIVIEKPAGLVVHPAPGSPSGTLVNALLHHFGGDLSGVGGEKRPGIVHRIDKDTSGLIVVAKTDRAHHGLAAQFEAKSAERLYRALCFGVPDPGDPRLMGTRGVSSEPGGGIVIVIEDRATGDEGVRARARHGGTGQCRPGDQGARHGRRPAGRRPHRRGSGWHKPKH